MTREDSSATIFTVADSLLLVLFRETAGRRSSRNPGQLKEFNALETGGFDHQIESSLEFEMIIFDPSLEDWTREQTSFLSAVSLTIWNGGRIVSSFLD